MTTTKSTTQQVAGLSPTQVSAMNLAQQGIGSFQPFLQAAQAAQTAGLGTLQTAGAQKRWLVQILVQHNKVQAFMDPYQKACYTRSIKRN